MSWLIPTRLDLASPDADPVVWWEVQFRRLGSGASWTTTPAKPVPVTYETKLTIGGKPVTTGTVTLP